MTDRMQGMNGEAGSPVRVALRAQGLEPYDPAFFSAEVLLSANESPYGLPPAVQAAVSEALGRVAYNRYPDPLADGVRDALARRWAAHRLARENFVVGNGGDELLFNLLLAFGGADGVLVNCPPTFSVYEMYARLSETPVRNVPRDAEDFSLDEQGVLEAASDAGVVMITSPNNPTGDLAGREFVERLARATDALVVVDEAYAEFAPAEESCLSLVPRFRNVAVLRTFSKAFGLAGVRCGYLVAAPEVTAVLSAVRQPYSVDALAQSAVCAVLDHASDFDPLIAHIVSERARVSAALAEMAGLRIWDSAGNFVLVRLPEARKAYEELRDRYGVLVRDFSATPGLEGCLRITVGSPGENDRMLAALREIVEGGSRA